MLRRKNFNRATLNVKNNKKLIFFKNIIILLSIILLMIISLYFNNFDKTAMYKNNIIKENYYELKKESFIETKYIHNNKISSFIDSGNIYYSFEILENENLVSIYISKNETTIILKDIAYAYIDVNKQIKDHYVFNRISKKYDVTEKENYVYTVYLPKDIEILNLGEINISKKNNNTFFPMFFPFYFR